MHSTILARIGRLTRRRLPVLAALSVLLSLVIGLTTQTPALATVTVTTFAGTGTAGFSGDGGAATSAKLNQPQGVAVDGAGNVFIFDNLNKRVRKVDSGGNISTALGDGSACTSNPNLTNSIGPDSPGVCSSSYPVGFGMNGSGDLFFANSGLDDWSAHIAGKVTGSYAPNDTSGSNDAFSVSVAPGSLASPDDNTVFFAEGSTSGWPGNSIKQLLRDDPSTNPVHSTVTTIGGITGQGTCSSYPAFSNDGQAAVGVCIHPQYLTVWSHYLYFFDSSPGLQGPTIWRIDLSTGKLKHIAGTGSWNDGPVDYPALNVGIGHVGPIAISSTGEVYFGSTSTGEIRKVDSSGYTRHVTNVGATQSGLAFDGADNLYASLPNSNEVAKVTGLGSAGIGAGKKLVALGDSVAAGEGINYGFVWNGSGWTQTGSDNPTWTDATVATGASESFCHQSDYAYNRHLSALGYTVYNMACTGASALNHTDENGGVLDVQYFDGALHSQMELGGNCSDCWAGTNPKFDSNNPDVVTLTLGADDVNFAGWINKCYNPTTNPCNTTANNDALNSALTTEKTDLRTVLTELNRRAGLLGKTLKVVVTNYYDPFQSSYVGCIDTSAGVLQGTYPGVGISSDEQSWIVNGLTSLNANINSEVNYAQANDTNLTVSLADISNVMSGHEFCTSDPWVYGPSIDYPSIGGGPGSNPSPFHPASAGQNAIYQVVKTALGG